jgi:hypothetical protein
MDWALLLPALRRLNLSSHALSQVLPRFIQLYGGARDESENQQLSCFLKLQTDTGAVWLWVPYAPVNLLCFTLQA